MKVLVFPALLAIAIIVGPPQSAVSKTTPAAALPAVVAAAPVIQQKPARNELTKKITPTAKSEAVMARR